MADTHMSADKRLIFWVGRRYGHARAAASGEQAVGDVGGRLSKQGSPTVTISGGCRPISEQQSAGGKMIGVEVGRSCSFTWGEVDVLKDLQIRF
ncbi:MAG TPA: hypothetical protein VGL01_14245 [Trinickia sp.]|uniref:hypothetical protein n=1 Tax=Trinickia sp. TaxID=2571163 RepID=UPI002F404C98